MIRRETSDPGPFNSSVCDKRREKPGTVKFNCVPGPFNLLDHPVGPVVFDAIDWYGQLRDCYPNYRDRMLEFLASEDLGRRKFALRYFTTYAKQGEVEPLLRFRNDDYAGEVSHMGDWEYELRNRALEIIEKQLGKRFPRILRSEPHEGARVTWYDWTPVLEWWLSQKKVAADAPPASRR